MAEKIEKPSYVKEYKKDFYILKNNHSRKRIIWKTNKTNKQNTLRVLQNANVEEELYKGN